MRKELSSDVMRGITCRKSRESIRSRLSDSSLVLTIEHKTGSAFTELLDHESRLRLVNSGDARGEVANARRMSLSMTNSSSSLILSE